MTKFYNSLVNPLLWDPDINWIIERGYGNFAVSYPIPDEHFLDNLEMECYMPTLIDSPFHEFFVETLYLIEELMEDWEDLEDLGEEDLL